MAFVDRDIGSGATTSVQEAMLHYKRICQKVIPGGIGLVGDALMALNERTAVIDWGWQGLLAYGCRSVVVIVDTVNVQIVQTLYDHPCSSAVVKVRWSKNWSCRPLRLASADVAGNIIVWDVAEGKQLCNLFDGHSIRPISELEWISSTENAYDMLAALHYPHSFIVWNTQTGTQLWKKQYKESLHAFTFDPFCSSNVAFLGKDYILLVEDFSLGKVPSSNGRKFFVYSPLSGASTLSTVSEDKGGTAVRHRLRNRVRLLVGAESKPSRSEESVPTGECLALAYHPAFRHHLLLSYAKEVLIVDLEINQTIGIVTPERNSSPFVQVLPCAQRDALCCLHDNGMLSLHVRRSPSCSSTSPLNIREPNESSDSESYLEVVYDTVAQSDPIRLTKLHRVLGVAICPTSECNFTLLLSDGRVLFLDLQPRHTQNLSPLSTLLDLEPPLYDSERDTNFAPSQLKFVVTGVLQNAAAPPLVVRMCPPLTMQNWSVYEPLLAAGSTTGLIQIIDMSSGMLHKELTVHTYPVRGIEWVSLTAVLSFAHQNLSNSNGQVKNELFLTDVPTGKSKMLRTEKPEESPIEMLRVSSLKQYFIVAFKDDPFELWDLRSQTLLRAMPKRFPIITALEWMPTRFSKHGKRQASFTETTDDDVDGGRAVNAHSSAFTVGHSDPAKQSSTVGVREQFTFMDTDSQLYQFYVEGSVIKEGAKLPRESGMGSITTLAWKGVLMAMGDVDGNLTLWDLRSKKSQSIITRRGWIKKVRFAPGRGNMKVLVLYSDGVDIWDIIEAKLCGQVRSPKDVPGIDDVDWAASDRPILVTKDGLIRVMNIALENAPSPMRDWACLVDVCCPVLLPPSLNAFHSLIHSRVFDHSSVLSSDFWTSATLSETVRSSLKYFDEYIDSINQMLSRECRDCPLKTAHYCFLISRLFGYETEMRFWTVASKYLRADLKRKNSWIESQCNQCNSSHLDASYDLLCDTDTYKHLQLNRLTVHQGKSQGMSDVHSRRCSETLLLLRETDRAVRHLLETGPSSEHFYVDSLRACVAAGVHAASHSAQSTVKLVATNLIANGCVTEGVQLLCLIGKGLDACRYLQSYGQWEKAMWLAKCTLGESECLEVAKRWSDHLASAQADQPKKAILLLLSMHQFARVIEMHMSCGLIETAAIFAKICENIGVLEVNETNHRLLTDVYARYKAYQC